ncbi:MAG: hypothetical protein OZSIB_1231 [Candidatus Ozemobacter sibiricus]|uniref:Uncharacterized protein n=1 Tax=Candidatus Ozemobacter sibiricus TaxID=2268124 RepID=A0A367ZKT2_9BACT|nr:MAG: hypothetical protein OZSIB_1231 [Candidatus Ozemobacter sibiricus]
MVRPGEYLHGIFPRVRESTHDTHWVLVIQDFRISRQAIQPI